MIGPIRVLLEQGMLFATSFLLYMGQIDIYCNYSIYLSESRHVCSLYIMQQHLMQQNLFLS